jgi:hypothetical protein
MYLPDLSVYDLHRTVGDSPVRGVPVPGLTATYFRRSGPGRTATAGLYAYQGVELFVAWGYAGERHCRFHAFRDLDGGWEQARPGCPRVRAVQAGGQVTGLLLRTRSGERTLPVQSALVAASAGA